MPEELAELSLGHFELTGEFAFGWHLVTIGQGGAESRDDGLDRIGGGLGVGCAGSIGRQT
jgi:hypothetical protein